MGRRRRRRRRWWRRLHPSWAWGRRGRRGTGHAAGISVRLLGAAGLSVLAHGCGQHHARRDRPGLAAGESARGAAPGHGRSLAGVPVPSPLVLPGGAGRRREGGGGEAVPAAPPPPPPAGPARPSGPLWGGGQGASPGRLEPLGARVVRGAMPAAPGHGVCHPSPRTLRVRGPAPRSAVQPREAARSTPARRRTPSSRLSS